MGVPWLDQPISLAWHPPNECTLNDTTQCEYQLGYWRNWNVADYHYGLPTIALFMVGIGVFVIASAAQEFLLKPFLESTLAQRAKASWRFFSYRIFRIPFLDWNSAPLGLLLLATIGVVYFLCMTLVPQPYYWPNTPTITYGDQPPLATRSGWLSIACLPFVLATAGKPNLITLVTGVSHERLQVFHRWVSYAFFVTALVHTFPFIVYHISVGDMGQMWRTEIYYWTGTIAILAQGWLTFASFGPLRERAYEFFKYTHFLAALIFMLFLFFHCDGEFSSWDYFIATGVLFTLSFLHRHLRIYFEHGLQHHADLHIESNGFIKVTIPTKATWRVGQHFFLRFLTSDLHALTTHPFTACSLPEAADLHEEKENELVFEIRSRGGMTASLAQQAHKRLRVLLDGPYGGINMRQFDSCPHNLIIAGGAGAGWTLPFLLAHLRKSDFACSTLKIVLATRDAEGRQWFEDTVQEILSSQAHDEVSVNIYYTGPQNSGSPTTWRRPIEYDKKPYVGELAGFHHSKQPLECQDVGIIHHMFRPDLPAIINHEADMHQRLGVYVCGPLEMQADVANAVAKQQIEAMRDGRGDVYLHMEHFSWA